MSAQRHDVPPTRAEPASPRDLTRLAALGDLSPLREARCFRSGFPRPRRRRRAMPAVARAREGLGTLPGFPLQARAEPASSAGSEASREGLGTLPGFPLQ